MDANGLTNTPYTASIAQPNLLVESAPPSSGSLPADLVRTLQAATSQSLGSDTLDDWARIRGDFIPPEPLMDSWRTYFTVDTVDDTGFGGDVKRYQDSLAKEGKAPTLVTTGLVAHIDKLDEDSRLHALMLLLGLHGGPDGVTFDKSKLDILAASRWLECFPDADEKEEIPALIRRSLSAG